MLEIGSVVDGKYKILNVVGRGGMSVVYLAMNEKANKQWAIKEVRKDGVSNFEVIKQGLIVETDMLKKFNHPLLPSIVDVIDSDGKFLIVMDYIEGKPLSDSLQENGALPQEDVIKWAIQLCDVLGYLHRQEPPIIYRDMKPANVMLKPDGNITLIDFGTAREDELDLLTLFINNGISVCAGGSTGSGKTTTLSYLLSTIDQKKRLLSMEEGSREFMLRKYNEDGTASNSVVSLLTRESDNDKQKVSLQKLVELAMRMDPEIVAVGEMRSEEAYEVSEVARTGHTVVSTIHSMSASATYRKMMTLAYKKYQMDTDFMMTLMVEAFPIIFFQKHLEDGSRKIVEVIEGMSYENGEVQYQPVYRFVTLDKVKDANGNIIEIKGKHLKLNNPSKALQERLLDSGVTRQELNHFLEIPIENADKYKEYSECEGESDA